VDFIYRIQRAQAAGALGVIFINEREGVFHLVPQGDPNTDILIPSIMVGSSFKLKATENLKMASEELNATIKKNATSEPPLRGRAHRYVQLWPSTYPWGYENNKNWLSKDFIDHYSLNNALIPDMLTEKSDIWSLAVTLFESIAGGISPVPDWSAIRQEDEEAGVVAGEKEYRAVLDNYPFFDFCSSTPFVHSRRQRKAAGWGTMLADDGINHNDQKKILLTKVSSFNKNYEEWKDERLTQDSTIKKEVWKRISEISDGRLLYLFYNMLKEPETRYTIDQIIDDPWFDN